MIIAAIPVAPAAPAAAITGALILSLVAWAALYGLLYGYDYSLGAFVRRLADMVENIWIVGGKLAEELNSMDAWVMARIADGIDTVEAGVARLWGGLAWVVRETADALVAFGADIHDAIAGLVFGEIPTQIEQRTGRLRQDLAGTRKGLQGRLDAEALARSRGIDAVNRDLTAEALARSRGIDAVNRRLSEIVLPRIRALEQGLADIVGYTRRNLRIRIGRLEQALAAGAVGAVAIAALTRVFPYWQCSNVRAFNRALCRFPAGNLGALLAGALFVAIALNPREVARVGGATAGALGGIFSEVATLAEAEL